jgi:7,8-dihydropterin-6-yl-methyl-4-(beta-D-ribofuranosyl)aminobenzene 5'-phosphate synthase
MPDQLTITILVDNRAGEGLIAEHGLSMWIEYQGMHFLFDTGQSTALRHNSHILGIDLRKTDVMVLSHGHYDHTGGIPYILDLADHAEVYCHPGMSKRRYSVRNGIVKSIGIPDKSLVLLEKYPAGKLHWITEHTMLSNRIGLTGAIPRESTFEDTGGLFYLDRKAQQKDLIEDDQALWFDTAQGLVVCIGCGHAGIINTLYYVCNLTGRFDIYAVIGGFHLNNASTERLKKTAAALKLFSLKNIVPCHCTGEHATRFLMQYVGKSVLHSQAGQVYRF